MIIHFSITRS